AESALDVFHAREYTSAADQKQQTRISAFHPPLLIKGVTRLRESLPGFRPRSHAPRPLPGERLPVPSPPARERSRARRCPPRERGRSTATSHFDPCRAACECRRQAGGEG